MPPNYTVTMTLQRATSEQLAEFAFKRDPTDPDGPPAAWDIEIGWETWLAMGKPIEITVDITKGRP